MEEVRQLVQEEGREARNLVAFHVAVDTPSRVARKPPRGLPPARRLAPRSAARLRSASAGRDKRSELRARYWALLFGDLQRSIGEIYNTVETHENQNECQEVILVLENYTRDFKALCEWFRLKWEYDNTPPPQRPQSLAWEIRKTDFVRPESRRTHSVKSSPSVSGKNSPCLSGHNTPSGKNSPNLTGKASPGSGKISPRTPGHSTSPKGSIEFFSNKIAAKPTTKPEPKVAKETRLSDIKEKETVVFEDEQKPEKEGEAKQEDLKELANVSVEIDVALPKHKENNENVNIISELDVAVPKQKEKKDFRNTAIEIVAVPIQKNKKEVGNTMIENNMAMPKQNEDNEQENTIVDNGMTLTKQQEMEVLGNNVIKNNGAMPKPDEKKKLENAICENDVALPKEKDKKEILKPMVESEKRKEILNTQKDTKKSTTPIVEIGKAKEIPNVAPKPVIIKTTRRGRATKEEKKAFSDTELSTQGKVTTAKLESMENEFLAKNFTESAAKNENLINQDKEKHKVTNVKYFIDLTVPAKSNDQELPKLPTKSVEVEDQPKENFKSAPNKLSNTPTVADTKTEDGKITPIAEIKPKPVTTNKKDSTIFSGKKESGSKLIKEVQGKDTKTSEVKDKKEVTKKITKDIKQDSSKPEDVKDQTSDKDQISDFNWADDCEAELQKNKDSESTVNTNQEVKQEKVNGEKKHETKSPEPSVEAKDIKKEDKDVKKAELKPMELKPPTRPAYSQAAAKPKLITVKDEIKTNSKTLYRSKTVVEIRANSAPNRQPRQFVNKNQKNKCSYPFNLTTGRTSLFDTPGAPKVVTKRAASRPQLAAGDTRNLIKPDVKTRPPRPNSLKINEDGDKQEKNNPAFEKMKDCDEYSSSDTIVTQIDMSRIESSESLKTIVPDNDVANSIEVLNVDDKTDNDGWLTVKSRRLSRESKKSKSHWANRFHQPSATTSLPTLNMIESPKSESNPIVDSKLDRAKSEQPQNKSEKDVKVTVEIEPKPVKDTSMIRQKSDVTGLRTRSSRNKALKKDKNRDKKDSELAKNRLHSSLESLTTGLARSQESTEDDAFDFDKWKAEFMTTFKYLEEDDQMTNNELLKTADPSEMSEIAEMTSQIEENERKISLALDFQSEADQKKLCQEEDLLNRQIMELQQGSDNDLDTETDDTETDAEILCEDSALVACQPDNMICRDLASCLEQHYESALEGMSWSERVVMLGALEELVARDPGRAQQLHAKLSQGIKRRGSLQDVLRRLQAKQARAENQRMQLHTERAKKIHQLLGRVEEVKMAKNQLIEEKRNRMERRLQKAAENRDQHLKDIVRKAHDEEEKLREIAFIKQLEAQNRRHEFLEQCGSLTTRLRQMRRERLDKLEQKAAREAAVGARRQALEAARKLHVESLLEKRKERDARREELKELKKQERDDAAREKAEGVKSRLSALAAAASQEADALRSRIRDKQDASQLRLESHLQAIREKATGPRQPTTSESQEQNAATKEEEDEVARLEQERREREKQKLLRKKARKLRLKMLSETTDYVVESPVVRTVIPLSIPKIQRITKQLAVLLQPLVLNTAQNTYDYDGIQGKQAEPPKPEFKYDFEDKMGKKKKKKKPKNDDKNEQNDEENCAEENGAKPKKEIIKSDQNKDQKRKSSKSNSACSSVSELSRASVKYEKPYICFDFVQLEKLLGELYRVTSLKDCNDNIKLRPKVDTSVVYCMQAVRALGHLISLVADREDLRAQVSVKCVVMCVVCISRVLVACPASALYFLQSPAAVDCVVLLHHQLGKDLSDPKELDATKLLCDLISVCLDTALCESRLRKNKKKKNIKMIGPVRTRVHNLISYFCLSGCVDRGEHATAEVRERIQTMLTLCADLCQLHELDTGPERAQAIHSMRSALGTGLMGSRAEFCRLFAEGATLANAQDFVRAARTAHLLRQLAEFDHILLQESFSEGGWSLEFRASVARLLSQHAPNDKQAPVSDGNSLNNQRLDLSLSEQMVLDLIVLVGYLVVNNPQLHETLCENWGVMKTLCNLPASWLVSPRHSPALLPTLAVLTARPSTARLILQELSGKIIEDYLKTPEAQQKKLIQLLKAGQEKAAKKQIKKEKQKSAAVNKVSEAKKDETNTDTNNQVEEVVSNGTKDDDQNEKGSDNESGEDEVLNEI